MYTVIEMEANQANPQGYGRFVKLHALIDDQFVVAYNKACALLKVPRPKMIHTLGLYGPANLLMAQDDMTTDHEVQLFCEFSDPKRIWVFEVSPEKVLRVESDSA